MPCYEGTCTAQTTYLLGSTTDGIRHSLLLASARGCLTLVCSAVIDPVSNFLFVVLYFVLDLVPDHAHAAGLGRFLAVIRRFTLGRRMTTGVPGFGFVRFWSISRRSSHSTGWWFGVGRSSGLMSCAFSFTWHLDNGMKWFSRKLSARSWLFYSLVCSCYSSYYCSMPPFPYQPLQWTRHTATKLNSFWCGGFARCPYQPKYTK